MCGITGILTLEKVEELELRINKMNNSIIHRGPNFGDIFIEENLALGHRRLSIIDTSANANQPMHSNSNRWCIVFNGEIYNFKEIKEELNYHFKTLSDTEVIIAAVEEKGVDWFISRANGMFAIALFDKLQSKLYIIRDRLGIKPLFYFYDGTVLVFASEIKAILNSGLVKAEFNELAVDEYLGNRYIRAPYTFFENIFQIEPGCYLKIDSKLNKECFKYWDLPKSFNTSTEYDENKLMHEFENELTKSIKYRLMADVPLGTYLSGGVDSSIITAITVLNKKDKLNTYTIGFPELNEFEFAEMVANKYNTEHHEILMEKESYVKNWERMIAFKDAPLGVPNEIPLAIMSSELKKKITVVLSGEGADELMGGYGRIYRSPFEFDNSNSKTSFYDYFISEYEYVPRQMRDQLINTKKDYRKEFDKKIIKEFEERSNEENVFNFFHKYHVKGLLQRVDITTMQTSVEARVPFLDHNLIEFVYSKIPYELKLRWTSTESKERAIKLKSSVYSEELDTPKYLLRKLGYKYLPKEIIERKKVGFPVPLNEWFKNLEKLAIEKLMNASWLKDGVVQELIKKSEKEKRAGQILWMFLNIEMFRKMYFQKDWKW